MTLVREANNLYYSRVDGEITADFVEGHGSYFTRAEILDGTWSAFSGQGEGDLVADPVFVSGWPQVDLRLRAASPAVDAGSAEGAPAVDLEGKPRDESPDIGAVEN